MKAQDHSRRRFLRGCGAMLALPLLDSLASGLGSADEPPAPRRLVTLTTGLGMHSPFFFPKEKGRDYPLSPYLEPLQAFRREFTVFSGLSHPFVDPGHGHQAYNIFLTGAPHPGHDTFRNTISLDQFAAEQVGAETRFPSLTLGFGSMSWNRTGVRIQPERSASRLYCRLFLAGSREVVEEQVQRLRTGRSILDNVLDGAGRMRMEAGRDDREKLDEYFESVREVEKRLQSSEAWAGKPKPKVEVPAPQDVVNGDITEQARRQIDVVLLALQTDSTRVVSIDIGAMAGSLPIPGVSKGWHDLSHHGNDPANIRELGLIEKDIMKTLAHLLSKLAEVHEGDESLLERTAVLFGSNMSNASSHDPYNLPVLLAGGGFKHGEHVAFDPRSNAPLCNLYLSILHRLGIDAQAFGSSTGPLHGLAQR
jgi:hypothetical protein